MAIELAAVYVPIIPSLKGSAVAIQKELGLTDTTKVGARIGTKLSGHIAGGLRAAATGTAGVVAAAFSTALFKGMGRLNALDQANQKLLGLGHSAESVEKIMANALSSVKGTAFGMDQAATVAASAVAAGIKPGQELERTLSLVADAATIAGVDMGSMGAIFNKVASSNKVQMDVINQLHDAGVPVLSALADYMGVTAEEAAKMASAGKINFETFQAAMEKSLGGAAKSSGDTFTGAMANVMASLGRVGAGILGGIFPKLAPLFQAVTRALAPLETKAAAIGGVISAKLAPAIDWLTSALSGGLGLFRIAPQIIAPAAAAFAALGSSGLAPLVRLVPGLGGLAGRLSLLGGPVGIAVAAFAGLAAVSPELRTALGGLLHAVTAAGTALAPVLSHVAEIFASVLVDAIQVATPVIAGVVSTLARLISWLTDSREKVAVLAVAVGGAVGAWATYKGVIAAIGFGKLIASIYTKIAAFTAARIAKAKDMAATVALSAMYAKDMVVAVAKTVAGVVASTAAWAANTAALVASKVALIASKAATAAATAAQWLFNAALSANPIGLVVTAIGALVGALIWFFTQTEIGQQIWEAFMGFLSAAWTFLVDLGVTVWNGLADFFTGLWNGIVGVAKGAWSGLTSWLTSSVNAVASWWNSTWRGVGDFFTGLWRGIVAGVRSAIGGVQSVIRAVVGGISSWWRSSWNGIGSFFTGLWSKIVGVVKGVGSAFGNVFRGIRDAVKAAFSGMIGIVRGPINGVIGLINGAIRGLNSIAIDIPDWVPFVGGQRWGVNIPTIPMLADGGTVKPRPGGTLALLAEAGKAESVVDTGLLNRALSEGLAGRGTANGMTVQGPLVHVDQLVVDSDERVDQLSQALYEQGARAARAQGKVDLGGAVVA